MRYRSLLLSISLLFATAVVNARPITLPEALAIAQAHSYDIKRTVAEADAAEKQAEANQRDRWPTLSVGANAFYTDYVSKLSIELPTTTIEREVGVHDNYQTDVRLTLPLYTGGRIGTGIRLAQSEQEIRKALVEASRQQIALETRNAWLRLYRSTELVRATQAAMNRVNIVSKDVLSLFSAGAADSVAVLEVLVATTKAESDLDAAQSARRADEITLSILLGLPVNEALEISDTLPLPIIDSLLPELFWTHSPTYKVAENRTTAAKHAIRTAQSEYLPSLSAYTGYSYGRPNLDRFNNSWNGNAIVGASLSWSLNLGGRSFKSESSKRTMVLAAEQQQQLIAEQLSREAQLARERMRLMYQQYENAANTFRLSTRNFALAQKQHTEGDLSTNRLLQIEADLARSEAATAAAKTDFYLAQSAWFYITTSDKLEKGI